MSIKKPSDTIPKLAKLREILINGGEDVFQDEIKRISTREPDATNMDFHVDKQKAIHPLAGEVLRDLYDSVVHIPAAKLFEDIRYLCEKLSRKLNGEKFYIYLSEEREGCQIKSNMYIAIMSLARNREMARDFVDFICDSKPLHHEDIDPSVNNFVYIDDVTFSGSQIKENLAALSNMKHQGYFHQRMVHIVIPYINPLIMSSVMGQTNGIWNIYWYTTDTHPKPVSPVIHEFIRKRPGMNSTNIFKIATLLLHASYDMLDLSLFYTDLKIADNVSIFTEFLLNPQYYTEHHILVNPSENRPVVSNCAHTENPGEDITDGNYCPYPIYKKPRWVSKMKDMLSEETGQIRREENQPMYNKDYRVAPTDMMTDEEENTIFDELAMMDDDSLDEIFQGI